MNEKVGSYIAVVLVAAVFAVALVGFSWIVFGSNDPRFVANGIVATTIFVFTFTFAILYKETKDLEVGVRTAITAAFTVAYTFLLAYSFVSTNLGLQFENNKFLDNFYLVYISIIGFYFGTTSLEKVKGPRGPPPGAGGAPPNPVPVQPPQPAPAG